MATNTSRSSYGSIKASGAVSRKESKALAVFRTIGNGDLTSREFCNLFFKLYGTAPRDAADTLYSLKHTKQIIINQIRRDSLSNAKSEAYKLPAVKPTSFQKKQGRLARMEERAKELHCSIKYLTGNILAQVARNKKSKKPDPTVILSPYEQQLIMDLLHIANIIKQLRP